MARQEVSLDTDKLFIGGGWVQSTGSGRIDVISPSTEEHVGSVPDGTEGDMDAAVAAARGAFDVAGIDVHLEGGRRHVHRVETHAAFFLVADHGMEESDPAVRGDWDVALAEAQVVVRDEGYGFLYLSGS